MKKTRKRTKRNYGFREDILLAVHVLPRFTTAFVQRIGKATASTAAQRIVSLIKEGYVERIEHGVYCVTSLGKKHVAALVPARVQTAQPKQPRVAVLQNETHVDAPDRFYKHSVPAHAFQNGNAYRGAVLEATPVVSRKSLDTVVRLDKAIAGLQALTHELFELRILVERNRNSA